MSIVNTAEELYKIVGKTDVFNKFNEYIEKRLDNDKFAFDELISRHLEIDNYHVNLLNDITAEELINFEYISKLGIMESLFMKYNLNGKIGGLINQVMTDYENSNEINTVLNKLNKKLYDKYNEQKDKFLADSVYDINNIDDNVGDKTLINDKIDLGQRDGNFIIIDGKVITGDINATHSQLINEYIDKYLHEDINDDLKYYKVRDTEMFGQLSGDESIAFGHIVNNNAFIETCENCTIDDATAALKKQCGFNKIYEYDANDDMITRLAKRR